MPTCNVLVLHLSSKGVKSQFSDNAAWRVYSVVYSAAMIKILSWRLKNLY